MRFVHRAVVGGLLLSGLVALPMPAIAGSPHVQLTRHRLVIVGTSRFDNISITRGRRVVNVTVNGKAVRAGRPIRPGRLRSILVKGRGGPDDLVVHDARAALPPMTVIGGPGNDVVLAGAGPTFMDGGSGDDTLDGGAGTTTMHGGPGNDDLHAGTGPVVAYGDDGDDAITAALSSNAQLFGGAGNDLVDGSTGTALLDGGTGDDRVIGRAGPAVVIGGDGADELWAGAGTSRLAGGAGDDTYRFDGLVQGRLDLVEAAGEGHDLLDLQGIPGPHDLDLGATTQQQLTGGLSVTLSSSAGFEDAVGGQQDDTFTGNALANTFAGLMGHDTFVHHGGGAGVDTISDFQPSEGDRVSFVTGGSLSAADLTLDATSRQLRDVATGTFGFDFGLEPVAPSSPQVFGTTDTGSAGQLITFTGTSGFGPGSNADSLIASYSSTGATIGGAGGRDRIVDHSPSGNSLVGRDGQDVLNGGAGDDTLQGDRGFADGVDDVDTGGSGADTFVFGEAFGGGAKEKFGTDIITDFGDGLDTVDLFTGLSVKSGLGSDTVTIWDGVTDFGTIASSGGHLWAPGDFS